MLCLLYMLVLLVLNISGNTFCFIFKSNDVYDGCKTHTDLTETGAKRRQFILPMPVALPS